MRRTNDLGNDPVFPLVLHLAVPTMLAQLVSVLYSIVDRIYIGNIPAAGGLAHGRGGGVRPHRDPALLLCQPGGLGGSPSWPCGWGRGGRRRRGVS